MNHILENRNDLKVAVIVNDMIEINIDASLVKQGGFTRTDEKLVEMQNGCICCTLREDLMIEVEKLAKQGDIDYIVIESTGISEQVPVAKPSPMLMKAWELIYPNFAGLIRWSPLLMGIIFGKTSLPEKRLLTGCRQLMLRMAGKWSIY